MTDKTDALRAHELLAAEYTKRGMGVDFVNDAGTPTAIALAAIREALAAPAGTVAWLGVNPRTGEPEISTHKPVSSVMRDFNMRPLVYAEALAAPAEGGQGEADKGPWHWAYTGARSGEGAYELWSDDFTHDAKIRVSGDFADHAAVERYMRGLCVKLNDTAPPAASVDVEGALNVADPDWRQMMRPNLTGSEALVCAVGDIASERKMLAAEVRFLRALIDSAGGAKGDDCPFCGKPDKHGHEACPALNNPQTFTLVDTPQPAEGDGAVDEAMVDRAIRAFENEPASHTDDDWDRRCMRAALTAALANQEQRHGAIADGEAASA